MPTFADLQTAGGHLCGEASSALQKAIRRGHEREALYWASELDLTGYGNYVWKRLRIIASEDVGLADPEVVLLVRVLNDNWLEQRKAEKDVNGPGSAPLYLVHAVIALTRAQKSRIVDHAYIVMYEGERERIDVPDYARDKHTAAGRGLKRGFDHFFDEGAKLENAAELEDDYYQEARAKLSKPRRRRSA